MDRRDVDNTRERIENGATLEEDLQAFADMFITEEYPDHLFMANKRLILRIIRRSFQLILIEIMEKRTAPNIM